MRLVARSIEHYPRAFDIVLGDGLYARADFFNLELGLRSLLRESRKR